MDGRLGRAAGAAVMVALLAAAPASAGTGLSVSSVSSLRGSAGTLKGNVVNDTGKAQRARIVISLHRRGTQRAVVGRTQVSVAAHGHASYRAAVKLPKNLKRGTYYLSSCAAQGGGRYGCATADREVQIGAVVAKAATVAAADEVCSPGGRTLSKPGMRVYPEMGNTGYTSVHSDVNLVYDAPSNQFLPGTKVDLQQRSTQCLTDFSLDFERTNSITSTTTPGPNMQVTSVTINGQPATFTFKQPTYPGNPNGPDDPDPLAHAASNLNPVNATNPNPPACAPISNAASAQGVQCPANKLVITPAAPIPSGTDFTVTVNYTGRPGVHQDGDGSTEGWFRNNNPVGDGSFVTTEPVGSMAWMPLNNHPSVKPTYDLTTTTNTGRTAIGNGRLLGFTDNAPDANFAAGSRTWRWRSPEPIASYLVENSVGNFDMSERFAPSGVIYYEAQSSGISQTQKDANYVIMHQHEDITLFQQLFNGIYPFSTDGVIVGIPTAGFEEEMQTKITFQNSRISLGTFHHENMHQWWGDNVSEASYNLTFFKEGYANMSQDFATARTDANNAGGLGTPAGDAAFEARLVTIFNTFYNGTSTAPWSAAPSNPTNNSLFTTATTYTRPGKSYIALRRILGKDNFAAANKEIQRSYGGSSITEAEIISEFHKYLPNQSAGCHAKLDAFFRQWWDTVYTGSPAAGNKPRITGPGLAGQGFYDTNGGCSDYAVSDVGAPVPATLSLTLGTPATFGTFTPGVANTYTASSTANVISTAGDALFSVTDPSANNPGHLVNGAFALPQALKASAISAGGTSAGTGSVSGSPLSLESWSAPISNDAVTVTFTQGIAATDALRTGSYSKTLTFTLSTTSP